MVCPLAQLTILSIRSCNYIVKEIAAFGGQLARCKACRMLQASHPVQTQA
jgi:hypothetical protein